MSAPERDIARAAGKRLDAAADVELALLPRDDPAQYADPIAIGGLIVSAAGLAWTIAVDLRSRRPRPPAVEIHRTIVIRLQESVAGDDPTPVIEAVAEETIRRAELED
ncbi:hypothetical protein Aca07nite_59400 [Actinoplanes capillaceus]|uniref:Uncharacterized protein n=1 Tax=Actinoplanes campanulatus TaxID=113559 RepID=A0ABQ3WQX9_9ACTN|nr:hypothetical protein [Actinoplanes capillaceus]GID48665.1 hypothetical protein Aca07nite_59400 [Actinoplanes capillaceus]